MNALYKTFTRRNSHKVLLVLIENTLYVIANPAAVCLWRGVWTGCDLHLLPQSKTGSSFLTHIGSYVILSIFLNANSLVVKGCALDGESSSEGILFMNDFLRYLHCKRRCNDGKLDMIHEENKYSGIFTIFR